MFKKLWVLLTAKPLRMESFRVGATYFKRCDEMRPRMNEFYFDWRFFTLKLSKSSRRFTLKVAGEPFSCACGANVFSKPDKQDTRLFECNGCKTLYREDKE